MEPKKNPVYDVHRYRSVLFTVGLMTSIAIVIMAFEWKAKIELPVQRRPDPPGDEIVYNVLPTDFSYSSNRPATRPVRAPQNFIEVNELEIEPADEIILDLPEDEPISIAPPEDIPVEPFSDGPVIFAEVMPEPESGYSGFYNLLRKTLRYPKKAQELHIQGKVFVEFVVSEQGELSNLRVIKGIGGGCDEEAVRVLRLSKWKPGKQRGKPVKVKMIQPIYFRLNSQ